MFTEWVELKVRIYVPEDEGFIDEGWSTEKVYVATIVNPEQEYARQMLRAALNGHFSSTEVTKVKILSARQVSPEVVRPKSEFDVFSVVRITESGKWINWPFGENTSVPSVEK